MSTGQPPPPRAEVRDARTASSLEVRGVSQHFGSLKAVDDVSVRRGRWLQARRHRPQWRRQVDPVLAHRRHPPPTSGTVLLDGRDVTGLPEPTRVRLGLVRSFQHSSLFLRESVAENVALAVQRRLGTQWSMLRPRASARPCSRR